MLHAGATDVSSDKPPTAFPRARDQMSALMDAPRIDSERTTADFRFCHEQFESIRSDLREFATNLRTPQLTWQPEASAWSIAQCVAHLNGATAHDVSRLRALVVLARAARNSSLRPYSVRDNSMVMVLHESPRQTLTAATLSNDGPVVEDPSELVPRFLMLNRELLGVISSAGHVATIATNPTASTLLDFVGHVLQLNALHHWRFILQARRVMERPGFPRA